MITRSDRAAWWLVLVIGVTDALWTVGSRFSFSGVWLPSGIVAVLIGIAVYCHLRGLSQRLGSLAHHMALWLAFCSVLGVLVYLATATGAPSRDAQFAAIDAALGFDWQVMHVWLHAHRTINIALVLLYDTFAPQIFGAIIYFALSAQNDRNREFLWALMVSALVTVALAALLPAACACLELPSGPPESYDHVPDFLALRSGLPAAFVLQDMKGIVTFPSYHTVVAVLLVYVFRRQRRLFVLSLLLNSLMVLSVPQVGGHYLVDVLGGVAVAGATIAAIEGWRIGLLRRAPVLADAGDPTRRAG